MKQKNLLPLLLMSLSLILLLGFESLWLNQVYREKELSLKQQANYALVQVVDQVKDSLLEAMFLQAPWQVSLTDKPERKTTLGFRVEDVNTVEVHEEAEPDTNIFISIDLTNQSSSDSPRFPERLRFQTDSQETQLEELIKGRVFADPDSSKIKAKASLNRWVFRQEPKAEDGASGMVSIFIRPSDSIQAPSQAERLYATLERSFSTLEFPTQHRLILVDSSSTYIGLLSKTYTDTPSGQAFALHFPEPRLYLFKEMWAEVLFGVLLFASVVLAFWFTWRSLRQQRRLTRLKNDFIANVTHELKTPITTVRVALEAMQNFDALEDLQRTREYLDISKQELDRLTLLVDRVLKMSLFEREKMELRLEKIDVSQLLSSIVATMQLQFQKHQAQVNLNIEEGDFHLVADRLHLSSVVFNLIDNALKYSPRHPKISLNLGRDNGEINISVTDQGLGIPKSYQEKIFDKFFRVPTGDRHDVKGHGLGLSYVAEVMRRHQGRVELDSQEGQGSTFTLRLPISQA